MLKKQRISAKSVVLRLTVSFKISTIYFMTPDKQQSLIKFLSDTIVELNISMKNVLSYPKGHPLIEKAIERAFNKLRRCFGEQKKITFGVARDMLIVEQEYLDKKNIAIKDFAFSLYKKGIVAVTFTTGLTRKEFGKFHDLLCANQTDDNMIEDISAAVNEAAMENIQIVLVDYTSFRLTEDVVFGTPEGESEGEDLWDIFIREMLRHTIDPADYEELSESPDTAPALIAETINLRASREISPSLCENAASWFLGRAGENLEKMIENIDMFTDFISNLKPELRKQFLSGVLKHLSTRPEMAREILSEFPEDLIIDMFDTITEKETSVPPSVLSLMQKLAGMEDIESDLETTHFERATLGDLSENEMREKLASVFNDSSPPAGDRASLTPADDTDSAEKVRDSVLKANIEEKEANIIFEVLEKNITYEEFAKLTSKLSEISVFFLDTGQFDILIRIYDMFKSHMDSDNKLRANAVGDAIRLFYEKDFMEEIINGFHIWGKEKYVDISILTKKIGKSFIPLLLDALSKEEDAVRKKFFIEILVTFGTAVSVEAIKKVTHDNPFFIRDVITIFRQANDRSAIHIVRKFVFHSNPEVRIEALRALLSFNAPAASIALKNAILSDNNELSSNAISLAGTYRVVEVRSVLLEILDKKIFWGADFQKKEACVRALGEIRDPAVLSGLDRVFKTKSMNTAAMTKLKMSIIRSMDKYPPNLASAFLKAHAEARFGSKELKDACLEMLDKIAGGTGKNG